MKSACEIRLTYEMACMHVCARAHVYTHTHMHKRTCVYINDWLHACARGPVQSQRNGMHAYVLCARGPTCTHTHTQTQMCVHQ